MLKRVTSLSESFYILNMCVLLVLRLFYFVNFLISPCQILPTAEMGDVIVIRVHTWWLDSYDVLNGFRMNLMDEIIYDCK